MSIKIKLWGNDLGYLNWNKQENCAVFKYDSGFLNKNLDISPIHLPLKDKIYFFNDLPFTTFKGLPGVFADSLPDRFGEGLVNSYFESKNMSFADLTPLDRLAYVGNRGMGALEYEPSADIEVSAGQLSIENLEKLAAFGIKKASSLNTHIEVDNREGFQDILSVGTSAGGARAKVVIAWNENTGEIRSGQLDHAKGFEHWLLKLDVKENSTYLGDPSGFGRIEYTYYEMAKICGIKMQECRLFEDNGRGHFMTKRYDRKNGNKLHTHSLCGIRHLNYENIMEHSYNHLFETARFLKIPYASKEQLFRRMAFNVAARNCDDHTKNFSFIMNNNGVWDATPAYDVCYSYDKTNPWVNGHMAINGKRQEITVEDLLNEGSKNGIKDSQHIIKNVLDGVSKWQELAKKNEVSKEYIVSIQKSINEVYTGLNKKKPKSIQRIKA